MESWKGIGRYPGMDMGDVSLVAIAVIVVLVLHFLLKRRNR